jgi:GTP cyclohydrolase IA
MAESDMVNFLEDLGLDLSNEHLKDTPQRITKMYRELFSGLDPITEPKFTIFNNPNYNQMIIIEGEFKSLCSHHFMPFTGKFWFGYIPNKKVCGLSKVPRVVEYFSKRPQVQERLTEEIVDYLNKKLKPKGCMLVMKAKHYCEIMRGVEQGEENANTTTSSIRGVFKKKEARQEFLSLIK